jgi:hypothetical protein
MTRQELLETINSRGAFLAKGCDAGQIKLLNINLQNLRAATLPSYMAEFYQTCGGIWMGTGYIFGPKEFSYNGRHPVPSILDINQDLSNMKNMRGKTLFGRNDLFWFVFDVFGECMMLDNLNLTILRKYSDPYRAMYECLVGGKI